MLSMDSRCWVKSGKFTGNSYVTNPDLFNVRLRPSRLARTALRCWFSVRRHLWPCEKKTKSYTRNWWKKKRIRLPQTTYVAYLLFVHGFAHQLTIAARWTFIDQVIVQTRARPCPEAHLRPYALGEVYRRHMMIAVCRICVVETNSGITCVVIIQLEQ